MAASGARCCMKKKNDNREGEGDPKPRRNGQIPVVGIGASAGGIGALEALLRLGRAASGIAYVVVQHLDPTHESALTTMLGRGTEIPVVEARDAMPIERDHIYVIPRNSTLTMTQDRLRLGPLVEARGQRTPIDAFFISLAETKGENAACVILSGTGSDRSEERRVGKECRSRGWV